MRYDSTVTLSSETRPGVRFTIARMSFARRSALIAQVRDLSRRIEFLEAGNDSRERLDAALLANEVQKIYLEWGLRDVQGLEIDGRPATPAQLAADGPEDLCREIVAAIRRECGLSEEERKN
jgi:hypothetical protein